MSITEKEIISKLTKHIQVNTYYGLGLYVIDMLMYFCFIAAVIMLPELWMKGVMGIFIGIKISNLATLAHDAGHNSLTKSYKLNKFIAVTALIPGFMNYKLWEYNHNMHHSWTNKKFPKPLLPDNFTPYSKKEFDALSVFKQIKERFYRSPLIFSFGIYFICERWINVMLFPRKDMPKEIHRDAWLNFSYILGYFIFNLLLFGLASFFTTSSFAALLFFGLIVPVFVFETLMGFTVYVQHTHERVAWHKKINSNIKNKEHDVTSVQLTFSKWLAPLMEMHHAYDHAAHHLCPAIPCYKIKEAQSCLNELLKERTVSQRFSLSWLFTTMRKCKLYDYNRNCWLDFNGKPTTNSIIKNHQEDIMLSSAA